MKQPWDFGENLPLPEKMLFDIVLKEEKGCGWKRDPGAEEEERL